MSIINEHSGDKEVFERGPKEIVDYIVKFVGEFYEYDIPTPQGFYSGNITESDIETLSEALAESIPLRYYIAADYDLGETGGILHKWACEGTVDDDDYNKVVSHLESLREKAESVAYDPATARVRSQNRIVRGLKVMEDDFSTTFSGWVTQGAKKELCRDFTGDEVIRILFPGEDILQSECSVKPSGHFEGYAVFA